MGTAREPRVGGMNEIVNIIDRRAGVGRPVERSVRSSQQKRVERGARRERRYTCGATPHRATPHGGRRIEVITSPSLQDKRYLMFLSSHYWDPLIRHRVNRQNLFRNSFQHPCRLTYYLYRFALNRYWFHLRLSVGLAACLGPIPVPRLSMRISASVLKT